MKNKIKLVCVNNKPIKGSNNQRTQSLTEGKIYETYDDPYYESCWCHVLVINDKGIEVNYSSIRFMKLEEWREKQLEKILNE
jgi:hypothetical protein